MRAPSHPGNQDVGAKSSRGRKLLFGGQEKLGPVFLEDHDDGVESEIRDGAQYDAQPFLASY
jgi:hypothetical protein